MIFSLQEAPAVELFNLVTAVYFTTFIVKKRRFVLLATQTYVVIQYCYSNLIPLHSKHSVAFFKPKYFILADDVLV